ncbi:hypothetical protein N7474_002799 [Penicillium riverlandense]|uniref:uncharacterized protein n=1 Tax=Penicillium riverlandense TaxID=1903569 RepID=UPI002547848C|nr:uncharacterized protein N7474_002799 [Penicillium riverlandense]KAJ5825661.1 hypothetical protein N7474_002799 [Penicillium riverlandense]
MEVVRCRPLRQPIMLAKLPAEVLWMIISPLRSRDISACTRTCLQLRWILTPFLYRHVGMRWDNNGKGRCPASHRLLVALLEKPHLGALVQNLRFECWISENELSSPFRWKWKTSRPLQRVNIRALAEGLFSTIMTHDIRLLLSTYLTFSKNMTNLSLDVMLTDTKSFRELCKDIQFHLEHQTPDYPLRTLRSFTCLLTRSRKGPHGSIIRLSPRCKDDLHQISTMFYLPRIEIIHTVLLNSVRFCWPIPRSPLATKLTVLRLIPTDMTPTDLAMVLSTTPNLQELCYCFADTCFYGRPQFLRYDIDQLCRALSHLKHSLRILCLVVHDLRWRCPIRWKGSFKGTLGSLANHRKLESLTIPFILLFGWEAPPPQTTLQKLPQSLRELHLRDDCAELSHYRWGPRLCLERIDDFLGHHRPNSLEMVSLTVNKRPRPKRYEWTRATKSLFVQLCMRHSLRTACNTESNIIASLWCEWAKDE